MERVWKNKIMFFQVTILPGSDDVEPNIVGQTGELISINGDDGIIRMDQDNQLKMINLEYLGGLNE